MGVLQLTRGNCRLLGIGGCVGKTSWSSNRALCQLSNAGALPDSGKMVWHFRLPHDLSACIRTCFHCEEFITRALGKLYQNHGIVSILVSGETGIGSLALALAITTGLKEMGFRNTFRLVGTLETLLICV